MVVDAECSVRLICVESKNCVPAGFVYRFVYSTEYWRHQKKTGLICQTSIAEHQNTLSRCFSSLRNLSFSLLPNESFGANQIRWKSSWEIERSSRSCVEPACPMTATSGNDNSKKIMLVLS
jgi:hypothetical protein